MQGMIRISQRGEHLFNGVYDFNSLLIEYDNGEGIKGMMNLPVVQQLTGEPKIEVGSIVRAKCGGPKMQVTKIWPDSQRHICVYWSGKEFKYAELNVCVLALV